MKGLQGYAYAEFRLRHSRANARRAITLALSRKGLADAENPPVKVRAAMTAFRRPIWAVMVPNVHRASPLDCASVRFGMVCRMVW